MLNQTRTNYIMYHHFFFAYHIMEAEKYRFVTLITERAWLIMPTKSNSRLDEEGGKWFILTIMYITEVPAHNKHFSLFKSMTKLYSYWLCTSGPVRELLCVWNLIFIHVRAKLTLSSIYVKRSNITVMTSADNKGMSYPKL